jgi:hypothetical protein
MNKMKKMDKKAQIGEFPLQETGKWILILAGLALAVIAIWLMRDSIGSIIAKIGEFLRFGR